MNRRQLLPIGSVVAAGLFIAACSSSSATTAPTLPSLAVPSIAVPSIAIPSIAIPSIAIPSIAVPSIAIPSAVPSALSSLPPITLPSSLPSGAPAGSDNPSFAIPSFTLPSEDKDLEAKLPDTINGVTMTKYSYKGASFLEAGGNTDDITALLTALGKTPDDLSVAAEQDATGQLDVTVVAFRVAGADTNALLQQFVAIGQKESPEAVVSQTSVGGKNVTEVVDPTDPESGPVYVYPSGDTLFYVESTDPTLAAAALQGIQ